MTLYSKKEIVERARELAKMISETEEVDFFKKQKRKSMKIQKFQRSLIKLRRFKTSCELKALRQT